MKIGAMVALLVSRFRRKQMEAEMEVEMNLHLERLTKSYVSAGMSLDDAHAAARKKFGRMDALKEKAREDTTWWLIDDISRDFRFAFRQLRRSPAFAIVAVTTLALSIAAIGAVLSMISSYVINPFPGEDESTVVHIYETRSARNGQASGSSAYIFNELRTADDIFREVSCARAETMSIFTGEFFEQAIGYSVTPNFFSFFRIGPEKGYWPADPLADADPTVGERLVISQEWWRNRLGADPRIIGKVLRVREGNGQERSYTVVGVMPPGFQFPSRNASFWRIIRFTTGELVEPSLPNCLIFAKLSVGVPLTRAQAFLDAQRGRLIKDFAQAAVKPSERTTKIRPIADFFNAPEVRRTLLGIGGATAAILLIVCANLITLQFNRGERRSREIAIRAALGASKASIMRLYVAESFLICCAGAFLGSFLGFGVRQTAESLLPRLSPALHAEKSGTLIMWTFSIAALCMCALGILPALRASSSQELGQALKNPELTRTGTLFPAWVRSGLVSFQVAFAFVVGTGAWLCIDGTVSLLKVDPGFIPAGLVKVTPAFGFEQNRSAEPGRITTRRLYDRFRAIPGVQDVCMTTDVGGAPHYIHSDPDPFYISWQEVSLNFFNVVGSTLVEGRWLDESDDRPAQHTIVVNETLAKRLWPGESAIGKRVYKPSPNSKDVVDLSNFGEIIGVVKDIHDSALHFSIQPTYYLPNRGRGGLATEYYVRSPAGRPSIRLEIEAAYKEVIGGGLRPKCEEMARKLADSTATQRSLTVLFVALASFGFLIAGAGLLGALSHFVLRNRKDMAIRAALGASPRDIVLRVLRHALSMTILGIAFGSIGAFWMARLVNIMLMHSSNSNIFMFVIAPALLLAVSICVCWIPAIRASRVNPVVALRGE